MSARPKPPAKPALRSRRWLRNGRLHRRYWAYMLVASGGGTASWLTSWGTHRVDVDWVLRTIPTAFRMRHDEHIGKFARLVLQAQVAALDCFDTTKPDHGAADFAAAFVLFRAEWNALVAANTQEIPRRAARWPRPQSEKLDGNFESTSERVTAAWEKDIQKKLPARGRQKRVALELNIPKSTMRDVLLKAKLIQKPRR